jgi:glycosyltransferase involved in cell wall biosynthesis
MAQLEISVIIPVFNADKFIERAVQSALIQPEVDEIILIDDGSTDNSYQLIKNLALEHNKIKIINHSIRSNQGPAATRNLGIQNAKNEWIAFLDADDYYAGNRFSDACIKIINDPTIDGVYNNSGIEKIEISNGISVFKKEVNIFGISKEIEPDNLFFEISPIGKSKRFDTNSILIKKSKLVEAGCFSEELRIGEDILLYLKLSIVSKLVGVTTDTPLAYRTVHLTNTSHQVKDNVNEYLVEVFNALLKFNHYRFTSRHKVKVIDKYIYFISNNSSWRLLNALIHMAVKYPTFIFTSYFLNYIKHIVNPSKP